MVHELVLAGVTFGFTTGSFTSVYVGNLLSPRTMGARPLSAPDPWIDALDVMLDRFPVWVCKLHWLLMVYSVGHYVCQVGLPRSRFVWLTMLAVLGCLTLDVQYRMGIVTEPQQYPAWQHTLWVLVFYYLGYIRQYAPFPRDIYYWALVLSKLVMFTAYSCQLVRLLLLRVVVPEDELLDAKWYVSVCFKVLTDGACATLIGHVLSILSTSQQQQQQQQQQQRRRHHIFGPEWVPASYRGA